MNTYIPYISDKSGKELRYVIGDATEPRCSENQIAIIPHVCNNIGAWGAGFVLAVSKKWDRPEAEYRKLFSEPCPTSPEKAIGNIQMVGVDDTTVILNMIAQDGVRSQGNVKPIKYAELVKCMRRTVTNLKMQGWDASFHCPQFGAGLAGGDWSIIEELIKEIWVDEGYDCTIYLFDDGKNKIGLPLVQEICPNCGADIEVDWGDTDFYGKNVAQSAVCSKCGCVFKDVYTYSHSEFRPR